jgi:hypothetical protein
MLRRIFELKTEQKGRGQQKDGEDCMKMSVIICCVHRLL